MNDERSELAMIIAYALYGRPGVIDIETRGTDMDVYTDEGGHYQIDLTTVREPKAISNFELRSEEIIRWGRL